VAVPGAEPADSHVHVPAHSSFYYASAVKVSGPSAVYRDGESCHAVRLPRLLRSVDLPQATFFRRHNTEIAAAGRADAVFSVITALVLNRKIIGRGLARRVLTRCCSPVSSLI
jgi:hypothetical protein